MKFKTLQRVITLLDIGMIVAAMAAVLLNSAALWVVTALLCAARIYLYLKPFPCPHCGKVVRPDRSTVRCPYCGERMEP